MVQFRPAQILPVIRRCFAGDTAAAAAAAADTEADTAAAAGQDQAPCVLLHCLLLLLLSRLVLEAGRAGAEALAALAAAAAALAEAEAAPFGRPRTSLSIPVLEAHRSHIVWHMSPRRDADAGQVEVRTLLVLPSLLMTEHSIATQGADALGLHHGSCDGVYVMWCGSRARGGDGMMKLAIDPADEACGCVDLRKAGSFTKCTLTAGPIQHCMDG